MLFSLPLSLNTVFSNIIYNYAIKYRLDEWKVGQIGNWLSCQASEAKSFGTKANRRSVISGGMCQALVLGSCINVFISDLDGGAEYTCREFPNTADWGGVVDVLDDPAVSQRNCAGWRNGQAATSCNTAWAVQSTELGQE